MLNIELARPVVSKVLIELFTTELVLVVPKPRPLTDDVDIDRAKNLCLSMMIKKDHSHSTPVGYGFINERSRHYFEPL